MKEVLNQIFEHIVQLPESVAKEYKEVCENKMIPKLAKIFGVIIILPMLYFGLPFLWKLGSVSYLNANIALASYVNVTSQDAMLFYMEVYSTLLPISVDHLWLTVQFLLGVFFLSVLFVLLCFIQRRYVKIPIFRIVTEAIVIFLFVVLLPLSLIGSTGQAAYKLGNQGEEGYFYVLHDGIKYPSVTRDQEVYIVYDCHSSDKNIIIKAVPIAKSERHLVYLEDGQELTKELACTQ